MLEKNLFLIFKSIRKPPCLKLINPIFDLKLLFRIFAIFSKSKLMLFNSEIALPIDSAN